MTQTLKTISEWEQEYGLYIVDLDGFDTSDPELYNRRYTKQAFESALAECTVVRRRKKSTTTDSQNPVSTPAGANAAAIAAAHAAAIAAAHAAALANGTVQATEDRNGPDDEPTISLDGWPNAVPPRQKPVQSLGTRLHTALERVKSGWAAWVDTDDEDEDEDDEQVDDESADVEANDNGTHAEPPDKGAAVEESPLATLATEAKATVHKRVVRPFAVRWRSRSFRRLFILFTLPTLATFVMDALYATLSRVMRVRWYWPALVLATDALIVFIAPLAPIISGPLYLWYIVVGLVAHLVGRILLAVLTALPFLHVTTVPFATGPFLNNVTVFGNRLPLYFHFGTAVTSGIVWGTVISSLQHLWLSRDTRPDRAV